MPPGGKDQPILPTLTLEFTKRRYARDIDNSVCVCVCVCVCVVIGKQEHSGFWEVFTGHGMNLVVGPASVLTNASSVYVCMYINKYKTKSKHLKVKDPLFCFVISG